MSRNRFDQLAKQYLEEFLQPLGTVERNLEVPGESKFVDVWFTPTATTSAPIDLGLLGRIAQTACLLEPFSGAPKRQEIRTCLLKLLWIQEDQRRKLEQAGETQAESALPRLWILAATITRPVTAESGGQIRSAWGPGIYFMPEMLKAAIVAIDQLPVTPETLWLRILGRNETQRQAIAEVLALPPDDQQRSQILELLTSWRVTLNITGELLDEEEQALMANLSQAYLEWKQNTEAQGREQGLQQGAEREKLLVLRLLTRQVGELPAQTRSRFDQLTLTELEALGEALLDFQGMDDLNRWLQENGYPEDLGRLR